MSITTVKSLLQLVALALPASVIYMQVLTSIHTRLYDGGTQVRVQYETEFAFCRLSVVALLFAGALFIISLMTYQFGIPMWRMEANQLRLLRGVLMVLAEFGLLVWLFLMGISIWVTTGKSIRDIF